MTFKGKLELSSTGTSGILNQLARQDHSLIMFSALSFRKVRLSDIVMNETYLHHISCLVFKRPGAYQYDHFQAFWTRAPGKITHWRQDQDSRPARSVLRCKQGTCKVVPRSMSNFKTATLYFLEYHWGWHVNSISHRDFVNDFTIRYTPLTTLRSRASSLYGNLLNSVKQRLTQMDFSVEDASNATQNLWQPTLTLSVGSPIWNNLTSACKFSTQNILVRVGDVHM